MSRPPASGLRYAPWDVGVLENSNEIDKLVGSQGSGGFMVYFALCQRAAGKTGYYYPWDEEEPPVLARKLGGGVTASCVEQTVKLCCRIGLFDNDLFGRESILTSRRLQRNFIAGIRGRRRDVAVIREYWLLEGDVPAGIIFYTKNEFFRTANPDLHYSKPSYFDRNEIKGNEIKTQPYPSQKTGGNGTRAGRIELCTRVLTFWQSRTGINLIGDKEQRKAVYNRLDAGATADEMEAVIEAGCNLARRGEWHGRGPWPLPSELFGEQWQMLDAFAKE